MHITLTTPAASFINTCQVTNSYATKSLPPFGPLYTRPLLWSDCSHMALQHMHSHLLLTRVSDIYIAIWLCLSDHNLTMSHIPWLFPENCRVVSLWLHPGLLSVLSSFSEGAVTPGTFSFVPKEMKCSESIFINLMDCVASICISLGFSPCLRYCKACQSTYCCRAYALTSLNHVCWPCFLFPVGNTARFPDVGHHKQKRSL